jgi:hypothetical protein
VKVGDKFKIGSYDYLVVSVYPTGEIAAVELYQTGNVGNAIIVDRELTVQFFDKKQQESITPV